MHVSTFAGDVLRRRKVATLCLLVPSGLTQAVAAEGKPHGIRACILYLGGMDANWGTRSITKRQAVISPLEEEGWP
jgi:hypothetical protein